MRGITVTLYEKTQVGLDPANVPVFDEIPVQVENVLVAPETTVQLTSGVDLRGGEADYILGIPKGDTHVWDDSKIEFFGQTFRSFGVPTQGIDDLIPLDWNMKVKVKRIE